jgi:hypothetical protein
MKDSTEQAANYPGIHESPVASTPLQHIKTWPSTGIGGNVNSLEELVTAAKEGVATLRAMLQDGVSLAPQRDSSGDFILATSNSEIAAKHDMHDERDFLI